MVIIGRSRVIIQDNPMTGRVRRRGVVMDGKRRRASEGRLGYAIGIFGGTSRAMVNRTGGGSEPFTLFGCSMDKSFKSTREHFG